MLLPPLFKILLNRLYPPPQFYYATVDLYVIFQFLIREFISDSGKFYPVKRSIYNFFKVESAFRFRI